MTYKCALLMGSESDRRVMEQGLKWLDHFGIEGELLVLSAHRNPEEVVRFAKEARNLLKDIR